MAPLPVPGLAGNVGPEPLRAAAMMARHLPNLKTVPRAFALGLPRGE